MSRRLAEPGKTWTTLRRAAVFAPLLAMALGTAGVLFGLVVGGALCLADSLPWSFAGWWAIRGAVAGLVAGAIMEVVCGIYHTEDTAPAAAPARAVPPPPARPAPTRPDFAFFRNRAWPRP